MNALMVSSSAGHIDLVKLLILYGIDMTNAVKYATDEEIINLLTRSIVNLEIKSLYNSENNNFIIEVWYAYELVYTKSYLDHNFEELFEDMTNLFPTNNFILWYNKVRLTPLNKKILTCTTNTQSIVAKPTNKFSKIFGCFQLC